MKNRVEAFILKTQAGQWMVEVWRDGGPIECTAGLELSWTPLKKPQAWPSTMTGWSSSSRRARSGQHHEAQQNAPICNRLNGAKLSPKSCGLGDLSTHKWSRLEGLSTHKWSRLHA
jgi:hypothetical protein